jgi:hypothetical protein
LRLGEAVRGTVSSARDTVTTVVQRLRAVPQEPMCFVLVVAIYAAHLFASGYGQFYYDSGVYWQLGDSFEHNGHFSLLSYHVAPGGYPRGYSLPLLNHTLHVIASWIGISDVTIMKLFGALMAAVLGVVVLPRLARLLFPRASIGLARMLALNALIFLYWRDHFDFPLSDFPALLVACIGLIGLLRATTAGYVVAGLGFGLAANIRPAYLPAAFAVIVVAALLPRRPWDWRRRSEATALVLAGALLASLPQMLINNHQRGSLSPFVPGGKNVALLQLSDGMRAQRYETYVGASSGYPQPQVFYFDPATERVLQKEHLAAQTVILGQYAAITRYGQYARVVVHHPLDMAAAYVRRLFNGLDVWYPTPYVRNLSNKPIIFSLLQYTLMFLAIARLLLPEPRRALGRIRWIGIVILLIPCLTAVPGAVEPRFFLPLQMLIYMLVCFGPDTKALLLAGSVGRRAALAVSYVAFLLVCLTLSSATLSELQHPGPTLGAPLIQKGVSADRSAEE